MSLHLLPISSHSDNLLGVGVVGGVVLWHVDPVHFTSRYEYKHIYMCSSSSFSFRAVCTLLQCSEVSLPITSLSWSPQGRLLAAGSPGHSPLLLWDVPLMTCTMIKVVLIRGKTSYHSHDNYKCFP